jgi:hypothetical protein
MQKPWAVIEEVEWEIAKSFSFEQSHGLSYLQRDLSALSHQRRNSRIS